MADTSNSFTLVIEGRLPTLNEYTGANRANAHAGAAMKRKAERKIAEAIRECEYLPKKLMHVNIELHWYEKNRMRDKDNICFAKKFIFDSLVAAGVLDNDGWSGVESFHDVFSIDPNKYERVEVRLEW